MTAVAVAVPQGGIPPAPAGAVTSQSSHPTGTQVVTPPVVTPQPAPQGTDPAAAALLAAVQPQPQVPVQPVAVVPPVVPQVPVAPQVPAAPGAAPTGGLNDLKPTDIADPQVRALGELLISSAPGLNIDTLMGAAIADGDVSKLDLGYLYKNFPDKAAALQNIATQIVKTVQAQATALVSNIHSSAGGAENWKAAVAAFNQKAPIHIRQAAAALLDSRDNSQVLNGAKLVLEFATQGGFIPQVGTSVTAQGGVAAEQGITKTQFQERLNKLDKRAPDYNNQWNALFYQRQVGKNRGI